METTRVILFLAALAFFWLEGVAARKCQEEGGRTSKNLFYHFLVRAAFFATFFVLALMKTDVIFIIGTVFIGIWMAMPLSSYFKLRRELVTKK